MILQLCIMNRHKSFPSLYNSFSLTQTSLYIFRILSVLFCICLGQNKQASDEDGGSQGDGIEYFTLFFSLQAAFNTYVWNIIGGTPDKGTKSNPMVVSVIPQKCT